MRYLAGTVSLIVVVGVIAAAWLQQSGQAESVSAIADQPEPRMRESQMVLAQADPTQPQQPTEPAAGPRAEPGQPDKDLTDTPPGLSAEEAAKRRRQMDLDQAAQARFDDAVAADKIEASQVNPAVRKMFKTLKLRPNFDLEQGQKGMVDGMSIESLVGTNPLARAGFREGDRLTRFNGQPLRDPSLIAHLFANLGPTFEVCAERDSGEHCSIVSLK